MTNLCKTFIFSLSSTIVSGFCLSTNSNPLTIVSENNGNCTFSFFCWITNILHRSWTDDSKLHNSLFSLVSYPRTKLQIHNVLLFFLYQPILVFGDARKARKNGTKVIYTAHGFHFYRGASKLNWLIFYPIVHNNQSGLWANYQGISPREIVHRKFTIFSTL